MIKSRISRLISFRVEKMINTIERQHFKVDKMMQVLEAVHSAITLKIQQKEKPKLNLINIHRIREVK